MLQPSELIQRSLTSSFGSYLQPGTYHSPLPEELQSWYANVIGSGHSIMCILPEHWKDGMNDNDIADYLVPVPVKTVLRGYEVRDTYIVPISPLLRYDSQLGLMTPPEDDEH